MKKTKIICTMGPACEDEATIEKMILAGMNVARFNFSHGTHESHKKQMDTVKRVRDRLGVPVAILLDTKGPEYRIGTFRNDEAVELVEDQFFTFTSDEIEGDGNRVSVSYKNLPKELVPGDTVLLNNGLVACEVIEIKGNDIITKVTYGGVISNRKSMAFPNKVLHQVYLSEKDKSDLLFGIEQDVDFVACSFVSSADDLNQIRAFMHEHGGDGIDLIAKIENRSGVDNIESIIDASDGIMVARASFGHPWIFNEINHFLKTGEELPPLGIPERVALAKRHLGLSLEMKGQPRGIYEMRRHLSCYFKGLPDFKETRMRLVTSTDPEEMYALLDYIADRWGDTPPPAGESVYGV